jgi:hypothetical protein
MGDQRLGQRRLLENSRVVEPRVEDRRAELVGIVGIADPLEP